MTEARLSLGKEGEIFASKFLKKKGYKIKETNYRSPLGEVDIIAMDGKTLVFIEVKTRRNMAFGHPAEAVNKRKQLQIAKTAQHYLSSKKLTNHEARIDVVSVLAKEGCEMEAEVISNAFELSY